MSSLEDQRFFDFATFGFREVLFSQLARDGLFPTWGKCVVFSLLLYVFGAISTEISGTLLNYFADYEFLIASVVLGCTLAFLISVLSRIDDSLVYSNRRLGLGSAARDKAKFEAFVSWVKAWEPMGDRFFEKAPFWYYLETLGGALLGSLVGIYWSHNSGTAWWGVSMFRFSSAFFIAWCAAVGYVIGASIFVAIGAIKALRKYCRTFVSPDKIVALNPDRVGGLKPFGEISLSLDIALSLPSTVFMVYLGSGGASITHPIVAAMLALYTVLLVVVFLVPMAPAHNAMSAAKERALEEVNGIFLKIHSKMSGQGNRLDPHAISNLNDVHVLYERVSRMAVWPLDSGIILKFAATALYPLAGSLLVAYLTRRLGI